MYIIAEAGINHNGDLSIAKRLADESLRAGADAVKFQTFWNMGRLEDYELTKGETIELKEYCDDIGIDFMSTPHTIEAFHFIDPLVKIHKLASPHIIKDEFLEAFGKTDKLVLMSTGSIINDNGMARFVEIFDAIKKLKKVALLHCVSKYPCNNPVYSRINMLEMVFQMTVGLSDHSKNIDVPFVPYLEKHIMIPDVDSIDEKVSITPNEFKEMVERLRRLEK